jgi:histidinol-phosphatase (PHP family)
MIDVHTHTSYSPDSNENPENLIREAINSGCEILGFSEHLDYDYPANNLEVIMTDVKAYYNNTLKLKEKYCGKITLLCGIEFGYDKKAEENYRQVLKEYAFDYVINSVHVTKGKDCYFQPYFEGKTKETAYRDYLNAVLESVYSEIDYQITGHIGYVSRNAPYGDSLLRFGDFEGVITEIFAGIIEKGKALEINTNVKTAGTITLPSYELIKKYYNMGGRLFSYGSDCHSAVRLCDNYKAVTDMLKNLGVKELVYFENKKMKFCKING